VLQIFQLGVRPWHPEQRRQQTGCANRQIDKKDAAPTEHRDQQAADHRAGRDRNRACAGPQPDSTRPELRIVTIRLIEERQRVRQHGGGADSLHRARRDQHGGIERQSAGERREREQHDAGGVHAPCAEPVAERARRKHQHGERERVRVDDPLQTRDIRLQIRADLRQCDVDDSHVELRDDEADADGRENAAEGGREGLIGRVHETHRRPMRRTMFRADVKCRCRRTTELPRKAHKAHKAHKARTRSRCKQRRTTRCAVANNSLSAPALRL
jgi:hypothetical protein